VGNGCWFKLVRPGEQPICTSESRQLRLTPGSTAEAWLTGLGATNPIVSTSQLLSDPVPTATRPTLTVGGRSVTILYSGLNRIPPFPLYYEVDFVVPSDLAPGTYDTLLTIGGKQSQAVPMIVGDTVPLVTGLQNAATYQLKDATHGAAPNSFVSLYSLGL